jgi:hypothetical protein
MPDKRRSPRRRTLKAGWIVFNGGHSTINCVVRNLSATGAMLELPSVVGVPATFTLVISDESHKCRVVRRSIGVLGVSFEPTDRA